MPTSPRDSFWGMTVIPCLAPSVFCVRLAIGVCGLEGGQGLACRLDPGEGRVWREIDLEATRRVELRHQAAVGNGRGVAHREAAGGPGGLLLERGQAAGVEEMDPR